MDGVGWSWRWRTSECVCPVPEEWNSKNLSLRVLFVHVQTWCARLCFSVATFLLAFVSDFFLCRRRRSFFLLRFAHSHYSPLRSANTFNGMLALALLLLMMCFSVLWTLIQNANLFLTLNIAATRSHGQHYTMPKWRKRKWFNVAANFIHDFYPWKFIRISIRRVFSPSSFLCRQH